MGINNEKDLLNVNAILENLDNLAKGMEYFNKMIDDLYLNIISTSKYIAEQEISVRKSKDDDYPKMDYIEEEDLNYGIDSLIEGWKSVIVEEERALLEAEKLTNFIDSNLTSVVTNFYNQLLSGKTDIEDWGNFYLKMIKKIIAQMLVMQTLHFIDPTIGGAFDIFGSLFGGGGSTLSTGAVSAGAGAITNNDGLERLAEVLSNQSINVNINPNAFIQSADTRILSQQNEIGTIQRGITSL